MSREPFHAFVSAIPSPDHAARYRGGPKGKKLRWSKDRVEVIVGDVPAYDAKPMTISFSDWAELQGDPQIRAIPAGGNDPEVPNLKAEIDKLKKNLAALSVEHARLIEDREEERRQFTAADEQAARRLKDALDELDVARGKLAKKLDKAAKADKDAAE